MSNFEMSLNQIYDFWFNFDEKLNRKFFTNFSSFSLLTFVKFSTVIAFQ